MNIKKDKYEVVHDRVRVKAGDARQWLVYINSVLRAECTSAQSARDFVAIRKAAAQRFGR